jgi:hypothetical protein
MLLTEIRTDAEYEFLKLWHSCKWMKWDRYPESVFMVSEGKVLFEQDWKNNYLYCKYSKVWCLFESKFGYNNIQIVDMISGILEEQLKKRALTPLRTIKQWHIVLEEDLKNGVLIPNGCNSISLSLLEEELKKGVLTPMLLDSCLMSIVQEDLKNGVLTPKTGLISAGDILEEELKKEILTPRTFSVNDPWLLEYHLMNWVNKIN